MKIGNDETNRKRFYDIFFKQQNCQMCGNCCRTFALPIAMDDIKREPALLMACSGFSPYFWQDNGLLRKYVVETNPPGNNHACLFYREGRGCTIYPTRPDACRDWTPTSYNCNMARLGSAGLYIRPTSDEDAVETYCKTLLHKKTKLDCEKDMETITMLAMCLPFFLSDEKIRRAAEDIGTEKSQKRNYTHDDFIDPRRGIPDCVREFLGFGEQCKIIEDLYEIKRFYK